MDIDTTIRLTAFLGVIGLMASWELLNPRRPLGIPRSRRWLANLSVAGLDTLVVRTLFSTGAVGIALVAANQGWGVLNSVHWPIWLEGMLAFAVLDFAIYLQHILFHRVSVLW